MTVENFLKKLIKSEVTIETISVLYHSFAYEFKEEFLNYNEEKVRSTFKNLSQEEFAGIGMKLGRCFSECQEEQKNLSSFADGAYAQNINRVKELFEKLVSIYYEVANDTSAKTSKNEDATTVIAQHAAKLKEIKEKLKDVSDNVSNANKLIDDKIFSLLINTVAILGIFVAIAFAGFGVTSIFSNIDFTYALSSRENLVKTVFLLFLVALLSYNLLILLVYFIYKLSRPLIIEVKNDNGKGETTEPFYETINLTPFWWIDAITLALTIGLFAWCQFL